jgi:hypothetical protein
MIISISGKANSGKDTIADHLVSKFSMRKIGLADPLKRFCKEVFDFSDDQLWGPSDLRNAPDFRYSKDPEDDGAELTFSSARQYERTAQYLSTIPPETVDIEEIRPSIIGSYLTPRFALQTLGTEWGRACYPKVWLAYGLRIAEKILSSNRFDYDQKMGVVERPQWTPVTGVVFSDIRFVNELTTFKNAGAIMLRVYRNAHNLSDAEQQHPSELEQDSIPDDFFHGVIHNDSTLDDLLLKTDRFFLEQIKGRQCL